jgi:hypothetical protein
MENLAVNAILLGALLFGLIIVMLFIEEKIPLVKDTRIFKWTKELLLVAMLLCVPVAIVSTLVEWANQPSAYDVCMEGVSGQTDDEAIAWMEEYCYSNR